MKHVLAIILTIVGCIGAVIFVGIIALIGVAIWEGMSGSYSRAAIDSLLNMELA